MRALVQLLLPFLKPTTAPAADRPSAKDEAVTLAGSSEREVRAQRSKVAGRSERTGRSKRTAAAGAARRTKRPSPTALRQASYDALVAEMKSAYGFRVRAWRRSMSGCAWEVIYRDGRRQRMLESPYPKSPLSCAIFLHEVGHHAIGLGAVRPRCLEELRAWQWSLAAMEARGLEVDERVRDRFRRSMEYAVAKAARRGIKSLPDELLPYLRQRA